MIQAGIIDPTKVVRHALQDAASVAGLLDHDRGDGRREAGAEDRRRRCRPAAAWAAWTSNQLVRSLRGALARRNNLDRSRALRPEIAALRSQWRLQVCTRGKDIKPACPRQLGRQALLLSASARCEVFTFALPGPAQGCPRKFFLQGISVRGARNQSQVVLRGLDPHIHALFLAPEDVGGRAMCGGPRLARAFRRADKPVRSHCPMTRRKSVSIRRSTEDAITRPSPSQVLVVPNPVCLFDQRAVSPSRPAFPSGAAHSRGQDWPKATAAGGAQQSDGVGLQPTDLIGGARRQARARSGHG